MLNFKPTFVAAVAICAAASSINFAPAEAKKRLTCTRIAKQCVKECSKQVAREFCQSYCSGKRQDCLSSGRWDGMERQFTNVRRK